MPLAAGTLLLVLACAASVAAEAGWGRHGRLYVTPCLTQVRVDGRLDEWDHSGRLAIDGPEAQYARPAAMWNDQALYLSGVVRDTTPLEDGDSCRLWLGLGRARRLELSAIDAGAGARLTLDGANVEAFVGAYRFADNGLGYTFEYAIPWATLDEAGPPPEDASLAGALRMGWGGDQVACDVLSRPGSPEDDPACWGRVLFCARGRLPRELLGDGLAPDAPCPLGLAYLMPADGRATLQLRAADGWHRRLLVAAQPRRAGLHREPWDGCDDQGRPLPAGRYRWDGLYHLGITAEPVASAPAAAAGDGATDGQWHDPRSPDTRYSLRAGPRPAFGRWDGAGKLIWAIGELAPWPACLARPDWLAGLEEPRGAADGFVAVAGRRGPTRLFTADGLHVASLAQQGTLVRPGADGPWYLLGPQAWVLDGLRQVVKLPGGALAISEEQARAARQASAAYQTACARLRAWCIARGREALDRAEPIVRQLDAARGLTARAARGDGRLYLAVNLRGGDLAGWLELRLGAHRLQVRRHGGRTECLLDGGAAEVELDWRATPDGGEALLSAPLDWFDPLPPVGRVVAADLSYTWQGERAGWASDRPDDPLPRGVATVE